VTMSTLQAGTRLAVFMGVAVLALGLAVYAVAGRTDPSATTVDVCIKQNGQVRVVIPESPDCEPSERAAEWTVGGEVTEIVPGAGLVGGETEGSVTLAVDPSVLANANSGKAISGFWDGPVAMPSGGDPPDAEPSLIAQLALPAGKYAIFAKLWVANTADFAPNFVHCKLAAGFDFDRSRVLLGKQAEGGAIATFGLHVVHEFVEASRVFLGCSDNVLGSASEWGDLKITAIRVPSLENGPLTLLP
jgi:hypothetical protein